MVNSRSSRIKISYFFIGKLTSFASENFFFAYAGLCYTHDDLRGQAIAGSSPSPGNDPLRVFLSQYRFVDSINRAIACQAGYFEKKTTIAATSRNLTELDHD